VKMGDMTAQNDGSATFMEPSTFSCTNNMSKPFPDPPLANLNVAKPA